MTSNDACDGEIVSYETKGGDATDAANPTARTYSSFDEAFDHFNVTLFDSRLPKALITLQRHRGSRGYFSGRRFEQRHGEAVTDEIALNPAAMQGRTDREIASTLAHEMVHLQQHHFGKPGRNGYHNKAWAALMEAIDLIPSHSGEPGGKRTGQRVTHYIEDGGRFDLAWQQLEERGFTLDYQDRLTNGPTTVRKLKARYACPVCGLHVWGQPDIRVDCRDCREPML